jgi:PAS domain S-box-containing protein
MDLAGWPAGAWVWAAPAAALAVASLGAALVGLRERMRVEQHAMALEAELERLQDQSFRIAESEERYRSLVEAQLDIIVQRDAKGRITFANDGFARLVGAPRETLIGSEARLDVVEAGPPQLRADGARLVDEAIRTADGVRWLSWVETSIPGRGGARETVRAGRDVTDRVAAQRTLEEARIKAEAASEAKSRFLATVSHEFRTPLNGILGMADLVLDTALSPEQTTYIRAVKTSGEALLSLIDEILDFSKIEAGRLDLAHEPFDLHALVEGVVELLAPKAQGKGVEIAAFIARDVPQRARGDVDRLRQVLVNLAGNGVKFTEMGGVGVTVERDGAQGVVIAVEDTGPGIAMERVPALFEEFEQGDGSPSRRHGGTGLGLAITRRIVERMGGGIEVDSRVGAGTTFRVRLPIAFEEGGEQPSDRPGPLAGKQALIVAHSPFEAPFLARRLEEAGAAVALAKAPDEALAKLATRPVDLLVVDAAYGDEVARLVACEARLAGAERRIVLLSPFERRDFGSPGAAGFDGYLVKPVRPRSLMTQLAALPAGPRSVEAQPRPARRRGPADSPRVLLAEDNEINALLGLKCLEKLGAVVDWAKDGSEALALAEASFSGLRPPYDLVLMDIRMPGLDGIEATRKIRALEAALGRPEPCRIVALTANVLKEDEAMARAAGLNGFLPKPLRFETIAALLEEGRAPLSRAG